MSTLDPIFGCELASGRLDREGYAFHGKTRAHIHAFTSARGPIAEGMELDHKCRRRACVALHHLELVTRSENEKRKSFAYRLRATLCKKHDPINRMVTPEGGVLCRQCNREARGARA